MHRQSTCRPTHHSPVSQEFKKALWSLVQPTHLGQDPEVEDPCPLSLEGFLCVVAEMEGRGCWSLYHLRRGISPRHLDSKDRLNLCKRMYICCYISCIGIFNFSTHSGFPLTEQDTGGKTFFMATWTTSPFFACVGEALTHYRPWQCYIFTCIMCCFFKKKWFSSNADCMHVWVTQGEL